MLVQTHSGWMLFMQSNVIMVEQRANILVSNSTALKTGHYHILAVSPNIKLCFSSGNFFTCLQKEVNFESEEDLFSLPVREKCFNFSIDKSLPAFT